MEQIVPIHLFNQNLFAAGFPHEIRVFLAASGVPAGDDQFWFGCSDGKRGSGCIWGQTDRSRQGVLIRHLYVLPTERRKGIGRRLVAAVCEAAAAQGLGKLFFRYHREEPATTLDPAAFLLRLGVTEQRVGAEFIGDPERVIRFLGPGDFDTFLFRETQESAELPLLQAEEAAFLEQAQPDWLLTGDLAEIKRLHRQRILAPQPGRGLTCVERKTGQIVGWLDRYPDGSVLHVRTWYVRPQYRSGAAWRTLGYQVATEAQERHLALRWKVCHWNMAYMNNAIRRAERVGISSVKLDCLATLTF